jgi:LmbE family N-acetylglucosaminyl deacetylase
MTPYHEFVSALAGLVREGKSFALGTFPTPARPAPAANAPAALIFSPHPDDECIIGALAVRLQREGGYRVVNVAVTQGSNKARQAGRWAELSAACHYLGFELVETVPGGLEKISPATRQHDQARWQGAVEVIARILRERRPELVFFPHEGDWNSTHIGTHYLLADALGRQDQEFTCTVIETEFWGAMATPNLMVESTPHDVGDMMVALSCHIGEVQRNPYHLLVPAWMQDNVRRGGELVGGQGGAAPDFSFATLYRLRRWTRGGFEQAYEGGKNLPASTNAAEWLIGVATSAG